MPILCEGNATAKCCTHSTVGVWNCGARFQCKMLVWMRSYDDGTIVSAFFVLALEWDIAQISSVFMILVSYFAGDATSHLPPHSHSHNLTKSRWQARMYQQKAIIYMYDGLLSRSLMHAIFYLSHSLSASVLWWLCNGLCFVVCRRIRGPRAKNYENRYDTNGVLCNIWLKIYSNIPYVSLSLHRAYTKLTVGPLLAASLLFSHSLPLCHFYIHHVCAFGFQREHHSYSIYI